MFVLALDVVCRHRLHHDGDGDGCGKGGVSVVVASATVVVEVVVLLLLLMMMMNRLCCSVNRRPLRSLIFGLRYCLWRRTAEFLDSHLIGYSSDPQSETTIRQHDRQALTSPSACLCLADRNLPYAILIN